LLGLIGVLALLFYVVFAASRATIEESSERLRAGASREIGERITNFLANAPEAVRQFQLALERGLVDPRDPSAIEPALLAPLLAHRDIGEVTLTYGEKTGFADDGNVQLAPAPRGQWSVVRATGDNGDDRFWSRHVHLVDGAFVVDRREFGQTAHFSNQASTREATSEIPDPTTHLTFVTPAREDFQGHLLWSDLHWSQLDAELPEAQRRVEMSVQQVVHDAEGKFLGVLRVGLLHAQLDRAVQLTMTEAGTHDPHRIFICDADGRLITRLSPDDRLQEFDDALRIAPESVPAEIAGALADPQLRAVDRDAPLVSGHFRKGGEEYLTTFRALPKGQDWIVGIVVPRAFYLGKLTAKRDQLLIFSFAIMVVLVGGGSLILRAVKRAQSQIVQESVKMNGFDFSPAKTDAPFRDVSDVLESIEQAKTAMRAMGKYVPVDLVRRLYREKSEPILGGEEMEISLMFTDIKDFTTLSEQLEPNDLADALGLYLDVMARIIQQETHGMIDKYIGDAIMTIWNAPEPIADHAHMACLAALRCRDAARTLAQSPEWRGRPPFETRFGLHCDTTLVGHFGAHDRMNYTAIGDPVNLASRLEGLNKQYGTSIIASERIVENARERFAFRLLDCVAVKGKSHAIRIYELLGPIEQAVERHDLIHTYERAFLLYSTGDFTGAAALLEKQIDDAPSAILLGRCRTFQQEPPPADWAGVSIAMDK
jgi:adenylate cyclase